MPEQRGATAERPHLTVSSVTLPDASVSTCRAPISSMACRSVLTSRPAATDKGTRPGSSTGCMGMRGGQKGGWGGGSQAVLPKVHASDESVGCTPAVPIIHPATSGAGIHRQPQHWRCRDVRAPIHPPLGLTWSTAGSEKPTQAQPKLHPQRSKQRAARHPVQQQAGWRQRTRRERPPGASSSLRVMLSSMTLVIMESPPAESRMESTSRSSPRVRVSTSTGRRSPLAHMNSCMWVAHGREPGW